MALARRLIAEFLGSALLAAVVIGSGIAAQRLSPSDTGLQLLENAFATALALPVLILVFAPVSGAHFNPVVSVADSVLGFRSWRDTALYLPVQIAGCVGGAVLANLMFGTPAVTISTTDRLTVPHLLAEVVATAGLILVIFALARSGHAAAIPFAVGAYIGAAYFLHELEQLRESRHHHWAHLQRHIRRNRTGLGRAVHRRPGGGAAVGVLAVKLLFLVQRAQRGS